MSSKSLKVDELSPDGFSRFFILVDIINTIYQDRKRTIKILDVGGGSEYMSQQLDSVGLKYELTILDIIDKPKNVHGRYIQGDATAMTFDDDSFDLVISTDVLEHIPELKKTTFIKECLRVASELCIIAAPFETQGVNDAEVAVNEFNKKLFGVGQDWLEEHLELGKPKVEILVKELKKQNISFEEFGTQNITTWLMNTHINLIDAKLGLDKTKHIQANQYYNSNIYHMNEFQEPTYRRFFVMFLDESKKSKFDVNKYTGVSVDSAYYAKYISQLFNLMSDRISALTKSVKRQEKVNYELKKQNESQLQLIAAKNKKLQELRKFEPLLRVVDNRYAKKARKFTGMNNARNNNDK